MGPVDDPAIEMLMIAEGIQRSGEALDGSARPAHDRCTDWGSGR